MARCRLATSGYALSLLAWLLLAATSACGEERRAAKPAPTPAAKPVMATALLRGQALYTRMCAVCHGPAGEGYKADRAPAIANADFIGSASDEFLRVAILEGRRGTTMSAWGTDHGGPLTGPDADDLIAFMRGWEQGRPRVQLDERPLQGDAARGRPIFERECVRCHGPGGFGGPHTQLAEPRLLATASNGFLRHAILKGRPGTPMEGYAQKLQGQDIEDLIAFVRDASKIIAAELGPPPDVDLPPLKVGRIALNPNGPEPVGFKRHPGTTPSDVIHFQLASGARMAFLDARAPSDYVAEHVAGAVSVPFYEPEPYFAKLPKDTWLVCYCACPHAESQALAQKLIDHGFHEVTVLDEGLGFWKMKGYPVRSGGTP